MSFGKEWQEALATFLAITGLRVRIANNELIFSRIPNIFTNLSLYALEM
jgi:hypothetical protein